MFLLYAAPDLDGHPNPPGHPERPQRVDAVLEGIHAADLDDNLLRRAPRSATRDELTRVHSEHYLDSLQDFCSQGGGMIDADTWAGTDSYATALLAAGAGVDAVRELEQGGADFAFVALRPPGHHARPGHAMGFCLLNNVAVAAADLAARGERVLVLDWDVHHGNGTQESFWDDPSVLYVSSHQSPLYPGTGTPSETGGDAAPGLTVNLALPPGATGDVALRAMDEVAAPVIEAFDPTWLLVSAGFDAHRADPLASLDLTSADFADLARWVMSLTGARGRTLLFLEGGYNLQALSMSVAATLSSLCGTDYRPEPSSKGGPGAEAVEAALRIWERLR